MNGPDYQHPSDLAYDGRQPYRHTGGAPKPHKDGDLQPPVFEPVPPGAISPSLTPYGRHHGLGPGVFGGACCDQGLYGSIESSGRQVWIWHLCSRTGSHDQHKCDRCEVTW